MPQEIHFTSKVKKLTMKNGKRYSIQVGKKESCGNEYFTRGALKTCQFILGDRHVAELFKYKLISDES